MMMQMFTNLENDDYYMCPNTTDTVLQIPPLLSLGDYLDKVAVDLK